MIEKIFTKQAVNKVRLYQYLKKELDRAGFTELDIVKTPLVTRIVIHVSKPGLAIGKGGQNIRTLTDMISKEYGIENPQIEIKEITTPELDSKSVIDRMKSAIERGFAWRSVTFKTLEDVYRAGAQGVEIVLSGKLAGKGGRKKQVRFAKGYMKKVGDQVKLVDEAKVTSYPKVGAIGLTVRIIRPGVFFPDKMNVKEYIAKKKAGGVVVTNETSPSTEAPAAVVETETKTETKTEAAI